MAHLTEDGRKALGDIADRHGVSPEAVEHVLLALISGQGTQAQFNHPDLGGMGQWSQGGMIMVGDMFNNALKARVDAICSDVSQLMRQSGPLHASTVASSQSQSQGAQSREDGVSLFVAGGSSSSWWPGGLGHAASTGSQNQMRYAWFPDTARLAIDAGNGNVRVYDTGDHRIGGFSQQQSGDQSLSFTSQHGLVKLSDLRQVETASQGGAHTEPAARNSAPPLSEALPKAAAERGPAEASAQVPGALAPTQAGTRPADKPSETVDEADIFAKIERLAALHAKGILTDAEYQSKKAELLARI